MPGLWGMVGIVLGAVVLGIGAGCLTTLIPRWLAHPEDDVSPSVSASVSSSPDPVIPVNLYPRIYRDLDTDDLFAGLVDLDIPYVGEGTFSVASGVDEPDGQGSVRWVKVEIEDGLPLTPDALGVYVMSVLNDERGWGGTGRMVFARTDGAAEFRIVFASPLTAERLCPRPHEAAGDDTESPITAPDSSPSPSLSPEASLTASPSPSSSFPAEPSCAAQGMIVVNAYRWADGLSSFGEDRVSARAYLLNHFLGHALGHGDEFCTVEEAEEAEEERASVMVDHEFDISPCLPWPWPNPVV